MMRNIGIKRILAAAALLYAVVSAVSCIRDDLSQCVVDNNLTLEFRVGEGTGILFREHIQSVDVFLFDSGRYFLEHRRIEKPELDIFPGAVFTVRPGDYNVVCWANVDDNSRLSAMNPDSDFENSYVEIVSATNGSPLYYTPYKQPVTRSLHDDPTRSGNYSIYSVEVYPDSRTIKEMVFAKVHRTVLVFIKGYESTSNYDGDSPVVALNNVNGKYDFLLRADLDTLSLTQASEWITTENGDMYFCRFYSALTPVTEDMEMVLYHPADSRVLAVVNLRQYIDDVCPPDHSVIPILVTFDVVDASVSVTLPSWLDNTVIPNL